jgi:hypothetical protein
MASDPVLIDPGRHDTLPEAFRHSDPEPNIS